MLFAVSGISVWAEEALRPRFEVGTSFVWGNATELVLRDGTYNNPISRLVWPIPLSLALNLAAEWPWTSWTSTKLELEGLAPLGKGTMVDEDWNADMGSDSTYAYFLNYGVSHQEGYLTGHWTARLEQAFGDRNFKVLFGGQYRLLTWEGWNGTGSYDQTVTTLSTKATTRGTSQVTYSGLLIAYRQQWLLPYLGASATWQDQAWSLTPSFRISPLAWCFDMDNHNYAGTATKTYLDNVSGGFYGQVSLEIAFGNEVVKGWGIRGSWEGTYGAIGDTTTTTSLQYAYTFTPVSNAAGAWFQETSLTVFMRN